MRATVGIIGQQQFHSVAEYYARMLALVQRITMIHLGPDFLNRASIVIGHQSEND